VTDRTLIVARMDPGDEPAVADIFTNSDAGELPRLLNVASRDLFSFHGLYFHLIETTGDLGTALPDIRENPLFIDIDSRLARYVTAYDPPTWRSPRDAMARHFYHWTAQVAER
jgi:cyclase